MTTQTVYAQVGAGISHIEKVSPVYAHSFSLDYSFYQISPEKTTFANISDAMLHPVQLPKIYQVKDLAFFCRIEAQLEKSAKLPVKFRLGDVQYVDYLEGKNNWRVD